MPSHYHSHFECLATLCTMGNLLRWAIYFGERVILSSCISFHFQLRAGAVGRAGGTVAFGLLAQIHSGIPSMASAAAASRAVKPIIAIGQMCSTNGIYFTCARSVLKI